MPGSYTKIQSITVGTGGTSTIEFANIPTTYDDLIIKASTRMASGASDIRIRFNSSSTGYLDQYLQGSGSATATGGGGSTAWVYINEENYATYTVSTFANTDIYIPNYASSNAKTFISDSVTENNSTQSWQQIVAGYWNNTTAINTVTLHHLNSGNFAEFSTATLYGIKKS